MQILISYLKLLLCLKIKKYKLFRIYNLLPAEVEIDEKEGGKVWLFLYIHFCLFLLRRLKGSWWTINPTFFVERCVFSVVVSVFNSKVSSLFSCLLLLISNSSFSSLNFLLFLLIQIRVRCYCAVILFSLLIFV